MGKQVKVEVTSSNADVEVQTSVNGSIELSQGESMIAYIAQSTPGNVSIVGGAGQATVELSVTRSKSGVYAHVKVKESSTGTGTLLDIGGAPVVFSLEDTDTLLFEEVV